MPDIVDQQTRSRMMAGIRGRDTKPELLIRQQLHALGFRYRLHAPDVPGKPDLALPRYRAAIFINGCFWHGHDCYLFRMPGTRREFWEAKIARNRQRDHEVKKLLAEAGWRQLTIWECAFRGVGKLGIPRTVELTSTWITELHDSAEIRGAT